MFHTSSLSSGFKYINSKNSNSSIITIAYNVLHYRIARVFLVTKSIVYTPCPSGQVCVRYAERLLATYGGSNYYQNHNNRGRDAESFRSTEAGCNMGQDLQHQIPPCEAEAEKVREWLRRNEIHRGQIGVGFERIHESVQAFAGPDPTITTAMLGRLLGRDGIYRSQLSTGGRTYLNKEQ